MNKVKQVWLKIVKSARSSKCSTIAKIFPKCCPQKQLADWIPSRMGSAVIDM